MEVTLWGEGGEMGTAERGGGRWGEMSEETTWKMEENEGEMRGGNGREII